MDKSSINAQKSLVQLQAQANELYQIISSESSRPALSLLGILNKLNSFDGPWKEVPDQQVIEFLFLGSKSLPTTHEACSAFCKFMFKQCSKQIRLSSLRSFQFDSCITFLLNGLETTEAPELRVDLLRALSALVFENTSNVSRFYPRLATNLLVLANRSIKPLEVRRMAINCIGNTCAGAGPKLNAYYKDYYEVLLSNLCVVDHTSRGTIMVASSSLDFTDPGVRKIASSTLRALQFLLSQDKTLVTNPLCDMIDIVYNFVFAHVSVQAYNPIPPKIDNPMPIQLSASTSKQRLGQIRTQQQQQQQQPISPSTRTQFSWRPSMLSRTMGALSSDSELSDSDSPLNSLRKQRDDAKIRINALLCLAAIAKTSPRALYPNWHKFIPDSMTIFFNNNTEIGSNSQRLSPTLRSDNQPFSLFTLIIYDPTVTVRTAACNALIAMLEGSKQYLSIASERDTKSSFTSLSERVASILRDLHAGIMIALNKEQTPQVQALLLKAATNLVQNCSYERLALGHLTKLYRSVLSNWNKSSISLRIGILQVLSAIVEARPGKGEVSELIKSNLEIEDKTLPCLPNLLLEIQGNQTDPGYTELKVEKWQTFGMLAKSQFSLILNLWPDIKPDFEESLGDKDPLVRAAALRFIECYASSMDKSLAEDQDTELMQEYIDWWIVMIGEYIQQTSLDSEGIVRAISCDCVGSISKYIFARLNPRIQTLLVTLILPLPRDEDPNVRAAACRTLGVFVLFQDLREDPLFVSDMASALMEQMNDKVINVRVRASWAQGNLCDALVLESEKQGFCIEEWVSTSLWTDLISTATTAALDNDKLRSNAVRALGSLLRITPCSYFDQGRIMLLLKNAMTALIKNIETGTLKTRWNACHAANNMLRNPDFPVGYMDKDQMYPWTTGFYRALCSSLTQCKNFKVRINACLALTRPSLQAQYGSPDQFKSIVNSVVEAYKTCLDDKETEFQELGYKDQLKLKTIEALGHMEPWIGPGKIKEDVDCILKNNEQLTTNNEQ